MRKFYWFILFFVIAVCVFLIIRSGFSNSEKEHNRVLHQSEVRKGLNFNSDSTACLPYYGNITHSPFGYPIDSDTTDDFIIVREQYVLSYCGSKNVTNWVAWELNNYWLGDEDRYSGRFITDNSLPEHYARVTHDDYTNSGYDRGHIVRSKERTRNAEDNKSTFILTNIVPQAPDLNRGVWLRFEDYYLNKVIREDKHMYVVSGGIFSRRNTLNNGGKVTIPDSCYKIVLITHHRELSDEMRIHDFEAIAVNMPNVQGIRRTSWQEYITSIRAIENSTGYNFFSCLPDSIEEIIELGRYAGK